MIGVGMRQILTGFGEERDAGGSRFSDRLMSGDNQCASAA
jgi:hypothetical protein